MWRTSLTRIVSEAPVLMGLSTAVTLSTPHRCASTARRRKPKTVPAPTALVSSSSSAAVVAAPRRETLGRLTFDGSKAGLEKVDKATVQATIDRLSKNSAFYKSEQKKAEAREARIAGVVARAKQFDALPESEKQSFHDKATSLETALEAQRDLSRCFLHVDMDMFYAAVEERQDPALHDRPFAVGSYAMLTTSNYIARQYGVRSGMPGFIAKQLCPELWVVPPNFPLYEQEAVIIRAIAARYDPTFVSVGLDEVTMDITDYLARTNAKRAKQHKPPLTAAEVGSEFRAEVFKQTGLTCSGGISSTAAFAKMASNVNKPNGQHEMVLRTREDVLAAIETMPIRNVPGIGGYTEALLHALGMRTCADMRKHKAQICFLFKDKTASFYLAVGLGTVKTHVDRTKSERAAASGPASASAGVSRAKSSSALSASGILVSPLPKSISKSRTYARGFKTDEQMLKALQTLMIQVHDALLQHRARASCVTFFTTSHTFKSATFSKTLEKPTNNYADLLVEIGQLAAPTFDKLDEVRLIGVRVTKLERTAETPPRARKTVKHVARTTAATSKTPRIIHAKQKVAPKRRTVV